MGRYVCERGRCGGKGVGVKFFWNVCGRNVII